MSSQIKGAYDDEPKTGWRKAVPAGSIMLGSLVTIWPFIGSFPILPPLGLLMLLGWRLARPGVLAIWAPLPLGFFDDLLSGQPLGSAILLWQLCFIGIDLIDQRLVFRDFWQDWLIASGSIAFCLIAGRLVATPIGAHVDTVLLLQVMISVMLFPLAARFAVWLDRRRAAE
ncbi:MAG: rod shape-determining protein MreD [Sphingomonas sp.]|uniref:rod shape-determining protein MreD n=1 Tax=Sphingomonas sp. TaxID=28214 RepID=UPI003561A589